MPQRFWHGAKNKQKIDKVSILCVHKGVPSGKGVVRVEFYSKLHNFHNKRVINCFLDKLLANLPFTDKLNFDRLVMYCMK